MRKVLGILLVFALMVVAMPMALAAPTVEVVNTTAITDMSDTIIALLIALIPILLILGIWARIKGIWAVVPLTVFVVNVTAITDMSDTIVALLIALIPIILILGIWGRMKGVF